MEYLGEDDIKMLWDTAKYSIEKRRASGTGALSYMQNLKQLNSKAENCARKHFQNGL